MELEDEAMRVNQSNSFVGKQQQQTFKDFNSQYQQYLNKETELLHYKFIEEEPSIGIHFLSDIKDHILGGIVKDPGIQIIDQTPEAVISLKRKRRTTTPEVQTHNCQYCNKQFNQRSQLDLHYLKHHKHEIKDIESFLNSKIYTCDICPYETVLLFDLKRHILVHERNDELPKHSEGPSEENFAQNFGLNSQISITPNHVQLNNQVSITPTSNFVLNPAHEMMLKKNFIKFTCSFCKISFDMRKRLNAHLLKEHRDELKKMSNLPKFKVHTCKICLYETTHSHNFKKHMEVHDKKPIVVPKIKQRKVEDLIQKDEDPVLSEGDLEGDEKILSCPQCIYQTMDSKDLKKHLLIHSQKDEQTDGSFRCDQCDYETDKKLRFFKHLLVHTDVKPYECTACEKGFIKKIQLESHILTQHKDDENLVRCISSKIHYCSECSYKTVVIQMMKNHVKNKHNKDTKESSE